MDNPLGEGNFDDPGDLISFEEEDLGQDFLDHCRYLRIKLVNDTPIKQIWSRKITGPTFAFLLNEYITALNEKGSVIHFSNIWEFYLESELQQLYDEGLAYVEKTIRNHMWGGEGGEEDEGLLEKQDGQGSDDAEQYEKLPLCRQDVMFIFDNLRSEVIGRFDELLRITNTRSEREMIIRKME